MRKITVGAIQPGSLPFDPRFDCLSGSFAGDVKIILQDYVTPQLSVSLSLLEGCGKAGCTIATSCEDMTSLGRFLTADPMFFMEMAQSAAVIAEDKLSALAKKYRMYIIGCYFKPGVGKIYNTASLFDPAGHIAGEYRKTHLPPDETWQAAEGGSIDVIETGFGKIGIEICYDMMFPEVTDVLSLAGADVIFHPTAGYGWYDSIGEATLRTRANDGSVFLVTAKNYTYNAAGKSSVIDRWGQVLADAGFYENVIVYKEIDLDMPKSQPDWFYSTNMSGIADVRQRKLTERRPELYGKIIEKQSVKMAAPDEERKNELRRRIRNGQCRWS